MHWYHWLIGAAAFVALAFFALAAFVPWILESLLEPFQIEDDELCPMYAALTRRCAEVAPKSWDSGGIEFPGGVQAWLRASTALTDHINTCATCSRFHGHVE